MGMNNTGGPAFPRNILDHGHGVTTTHESGMTLRDYFAAKAMQAHLSAQWECLYKTPIGEDLANRWTDEDVALCAYDIADAMLKMRQP
jgi:hypothetical protein